MKTYTTEQISKYHPDKYADQISDRILCELLAKDKNSSVAVETLVKNQTVVIAGEVTTIATINYNSLVREVASDLGYKVDSIINLIGEQSLEINKAVKRERVKAGDQGMMFGYATSETESKLPFGFDLANTIIKRIEEDVPYGIFKGDAKTQVTSSKVRVDNVVISVCHREGRTLDYIRGYVREMFKDIDAELIINPSGLWTIGGAAADCGLTGRKIVCDQYGGYHPVGGGAFSGKDPSKVDRSASYMARRVAKEILKDGGEAEVLVGYGIGLEQPVHLSASVDGVDVSEQVKREYDFSPNGIIEYLDIYHINFYELSKGCHYRDNVI